MFMNNGEFEKISDRLHRWFLPVCFYGVLLDNINSQNFPSIKTYAITKSTRKIRDPLSISRLKTSFLFLAIVHK